MNWYYIMWLDAIEKAHSVPSQKSAEDKNFVLLVCFAMAQFANILSIKVISSLFNYEITTYGFTKSNFVNFLVLYVIPIAFIGINYFLFFYNKKYIKLIAKKDVKNGGKLFIYYFAISSVVVIILGIAKELGFIH